MELSTTDHLQLNTYWNLLHTQSNLGGSLHVSDNSGQSDIYEMYPACSSFASSTTHLAFITPLPSIVNMQQTAVVVTLTHIRTHTCTHSPE